MTTGRIRVYPYKQGSRSAKAIAHGLGGKVIKLEGSVYKWKEGDVLINWGSSNVMDPLTLFKPMLNDIILVKDATNKLTAFQRMQDRGVSIPDFAASIGDIQWSGLTVVRHKLTGHSGEGIEIHEHTTQLPEAPLYVKYVKKSNEYRVHIIGETIVAIQRKARDTTNPNPNWRIRNHDNGFIFVRQGFETPESVKTQAHKAIQALNLDFGAVDVIWNEKKQRAFVLEVNTAPGLEGQTIRDYVEGFKTFLHS